MALPALANGTFFGFLKQHHVLLASPHPPAECGRRLADKTGSRYSVGVGRSQLQGHVNSGVIKVSIRPPYRTGRLLPIWFSGRIEQGPHGGTVIPGTVGPDPSTPVVLAWISPIALIVPIAMFAAGVSALASGHLAGAVLLLVPIVLVVMCVLFVATGIRMARSDSQELLDELNTILDSTASRL